MILFGLVAAGACGALLRYEVELRVRRRFGPSFPYGTLLINVSGSFALGVLAGLAEHHGVGTDVVTILGTGLLGAYTTFSTFTFDTVGLAGRGRSGAAAANLGASLVLGLGAAALGLAAGHLV
ncbi:MAG TPA: fluoride efflux transporter CrcB [Acidimicrobiales bacterium]